MSTFFWKNLLKCLPAPTTSPHPLILQQENTHLLQSPGSPSTTATTAATSIAIRNFNSVYELSSASTSKSLSTPSTYFFSSSDASDTDTDDSPPDFAAIFASQRLFFCSPGRSNSIFESPETLLESHTPLTGGFAVKKYSPDPYTDFKHSMEEMIEARKLRDVTADWDYLHELLSCYLTLNPKQTHKFIISAFADIIICLLSSSSPDSAILQTKEGCSSSRRRHNVSRWLV